MANTATWGFYDLQSLFNQRMVTLGLDRIFSAVTENAIEHSRVADAVLSDWSEPTELTGETVILPGSGTLQPMDEHGNPLPVQPSASYSVYYPVQGGATAWGDNVITHELMTVAEANANTEEANAKDKDWMTRHILAAVLYNVAWTYVDKVGQNGSKGLGNVTIQPLANNDTVVYGRKGNAAAAIDNHYLFQAAGIADSTNPYPTIYTELNEHPSNGNRRILCYIATNLVADTIALTSFVPSDNFDVIPGSGVDRATNAPNVGPGDRVLGTIAGTNCWIIEWGSLPAGYIISKIEGKKFIKMREYPAPGLKGFRPSRHSPDGNHTLFMYRRDAGFGVFDRVAACVTLIGAGSYTPPTGYTVMPLPV